MVSILLQIFCFSSPSLWEPFQEDKLKLVSQLLSCPLNKTKKKKNKKKRTCRIVDFAVPADHKVRLKVSEKRDEYLDLARELKKKLWNMKVTVILIVIDESGTAARGLVKGRKEFEIRARVETIRTTTLLRSSRILRRVLETWGNLLSLKLN